MAVTQQLARLSKELFRRCQSSENDLDRLISFSLLNKNEYLDLDWTPNYLKKLFDITNQSKKLKEVIKLSTDGVELINQNFTDNANGYYVYSDITSLNKQEVKKIDELFRLIDIPKLFEMLPKDKIEARKILKLNELTCHPEDYLKTYLTNLVAFYQVASQQEQYVAMWWD